MVLRNSESESDVGLVFHQLSPVTLFSSWLDKYRRYILLRYLLVSSGLDKDHTVPNKPLRLLFLRTGDRRATSFIVGAATSTLSSK